MTTILLATAASVGAELTHKRARYLWQVMRRELLSSQQQLWRRLCQHALFPCALGSDIGETVSEASTSSFSPSALKLWQRLEEAASKSSWKQMYRAVHTRSACGWEELQLLHSNDSSNRPPEPLTFDEEDDDVPQIDGEDDIAFNPKARSFHSLNAVPQVYCILLPNVTR